MAKQHGKKVGAPDVDQIGHVACDERGEVVIEPRATAPRRARERRGKAPSEDAPHVCGSADVSRLYVGRGGALPQLVQPLRYGGMCDLCLRKRTQRDALDTARQRVADPGCEQQVGRSADEEAPGARVSIDLALQREDEIGCALQLVDECLIAQPCHEARRISDRGPLRCRIVECHHPHPASRGDPRA